MNKSGLAKQLSDIEDKRGLIRQILPFLRSRQDTKDMARYLDSVVKYKEDMLDDPDLTKVEKYFHESGIPILNQISNSFNGLQGIISKAADYRKKVVKIELAEDKKFYKHFLDSKKERVSTLLDYESQIQKYIKDAEQELKLLKKAGGSDKALAKLDSEIKRLKNIKEKEINTKLRGYGHSNQTGIIKATKTTLLDIEEKLNSGRYTKGSVEHTILLESKNRHQHDLNIAENKHNMFLQGEKKYDFTLKTSTSILTDAISVVSKNPMAAAGLLRGAFSVLAGAVGISEGIAIAAAGVYGFRKYLAPFLWGQSDYHGLRPGTQVVGVNQTTGKKEVVALPSRVHDSSAIDRIDAKLLTSDRFKHQQGIFLNELKKVNPQLWSDPKNSRELTYAKYLAEDFSKTPGVSELAMTALVKSESEFKLNANSGVAYGLMQFSKVKDGALTGLVFDENTRTVKKGKPSKENLEKLSKFAQTMEGTFKIWQATKGYYVQKNPMATVKKFKGPGLDPYNHTVSSTREDQYGDIYYDLYHNYNLDSVDSFNDANLVKNASGQFVDVGNILTPYNGQPIGEKTNHVGVYDKEVVDAKLHDVHKKIAKVHAQGTKYKSSKPPKTPLVNHEVPSLLRDTINNTTTKR